MLPPVLENAYLLKSLGWAIANNFWQTGCLWGMFKLVTGADKKLSARVKHDLSLLLLFTSFAWFILTFLQNYQSLSAAGSPGEVLLAGSWKFDLQFLNNALPLLSLAYLALFSMNMLKFLKNLNSNQFMRKTGLVKPPIDFRLFVSKTALHLGIKKKIQVWMSAHVEVPSMTGFLKPVILLPAAIINQLSMQQMEAILLHEIAHIKRNDYLANMLQSVIELILFFNPFALLLGKAAKKERENCCDDWVMNFQYDNREYARALLILEEQRHLRQFKLFLAATNGKKNLLHRIKRLFHTPPQPNLSAFQKFKLLSLCLLLLSGIFMTLPFMENKPGQQLPTVLISKENTAVILPVDLIEVAPKNTFAVQRIVPKKRTKPVVAHSRVKKPEVNQPYTDYVNAYINEDLLKPIIQEVPVISQVADREIVNLKNFVVKIEEQQSGKNQQNTYYFELDNKDGKAAIKPLLMLNKILVPTGKKALKSFSDSLSKLKTLSLKRRVTS